MPSSPRHRLPTAALVLAKQRQAELNVGSHVLEDPDFPLENLDQRREYDEVLISGRKTILKRLRVDHVSRRCLKVFAVFVDHVSA